ncbi:MAG: 50S ribosomal protein L11 methyltransferase [Lachnospiraceae bacterium]|nr:50S ribosomal protein L11 methyltransferase [Lachnospiraceae bacterium]
MRWTKATIDTTTEAVDFICALLDELGIEGIEIEDNVPISEEDKKAMFIDILPELPEDNGLAKVNFYVDIVDENTQDGINVGNEIENRNNYLVLVEKVKAGLQDIAKYCDIGKGTITISETEDKDWINNWKEFFKPFKVADDIIIKPTWEKLDEVKDNDIVIEIDPGTAFGTGAHETTRLCIQSLREYIDKDVKVIDIGCGSGILSIIALKLGALSACGIDIDPAAITATKENMEVNNIGDDKLKVLAGNMLEDEEFTKSCDIGSYDIVVANILADVIIPLSKVVSKYIKPEALFVSSGIIDMKKDEVKQALLDNGFEIIKTNEMGDWVSFVAKKRA